MNPKNPWFQSLSLFSFFCLSPRPETRDPKPGRLRRSRTGLLLVVLVSLVAAPLAASEKDGDALMEKKEYRKAYEAYKAAYDKDEGNTLLMVKIARACDADKWFGQAVSYWEKYLEAEPEGEFADEARGRAARGRRWIGVHFYDVGDPLELVTAQLNKAIELEPGLFEAHYWLGRILMEQGQFDKAVASLEKAVAANPDDKNAAWLLKETKGKLEHGDEAYVAYEKAYIAYDAGEFHDALNLYQQAVDANPEFTNAHFWIARILMEQEQYEAALKAWDRVLELDPGNKRAQFFRKMTLKEM